jgi:hypothetical protein
MTTPAALQQQQQQQQQQQDWDQIFSAAGPSSRAGAGLNSSQLLHKQAAGGPATLAQAAAASHQALSASLQSFIGTFRAAAPSPGVQLPPPPLLPLELSAGLSIVDRCRIRDRSTILARHMYADMGQGFADSQASHIEGGGPINEH